MSFMQLCKLVNELQLTDVSQKFRTSESIIGIISSLCRNSRIIVLNALKINKNHSTNPKECYLTVNYESTS